MLETHKTAGSFRGKLWGEETTCILTRSICKVGRIRANANPPHARRCRFYTSAVNTVTL